MSSLELPIRIKPTNTAANLDERYGPHANLNALKAATAGTREIGLVAGLLVSGSIVDYQLKHGITDNDWVLKDEFLSHQITDFDQAVQDLGVVPTTRDAVPSTVPVNTRITYKPRILNVAYIHFTNEDFPGGIVPTKENASFVYNLEDAEWKLHESDIDLTGNINEGNLKENVIPIINAVVENSTTEDGFLPEANAAAPAVSVSNTPYSAGSTIKYFSGAQLNSSFTFVFHSWNRFTGLVGKSILFYWIIEHPASFAGRYLNNVFRLADGTLGTVNYTATQEILSSTQRKISYQITVSATNVSYSAYFQTGYDGTSLAEDTTLKIVESNYYIVEADEKSTAKTQLARFVVKLQPSLIGFAQKTDLDIRLQEASSANTISDGFASIGEVGSNAVVISNAPYSGGQAIKIPSGNQFNTATIYVFSSWNKLASLIGKIIHFFYIVEHPASAAGRFLSFALRIADSSSGNITSSLNNSVTILSSTRRRVDFEITVLNTHQNYTTYLQTGYDGTPAPEDTFFKIVTSSYYIIDTVQSDKGIRSGLINLIKENAPAFVGGGGVAVVYTCDISSVGNDSTAVFGNPALPYRTLNAALLARPDIADKVIYNISGGEFNSHTPTNIKSGTVFKCSGIPKVNNTVTVKYYGKVTETYPTGMTGGTVFIGEFNIPYDVEDVQLIGGCGINCYDHSSDNGLIIAQLDISTPQINTSPRRNILIEDVVILLSPDNNTKHASLFENVYGHVVRNVRTYGGFVSFVDKGMNGTFDTLYACFNTQQAFIIKSNTYSHCVNSTITNVHCKGGGGILFHAEDENVEGANISNVTFEETAFNIKTAGSKKVKAVISNVYSRGALSNTIPALPSSIQLLNYIVDNYELPSSVTDAGIVNTNGVWSSNTETGGTGHKIRFDETFTSGAAGKAYVTGPTLPLWNGYFGLGIANALTGWASFIAGFSLKSDGTIRAIQSGTITNTGIAWVAGRFYGYYRSTGGAVTIKESIDEVTWTTIYTFPGLINTDQLFLLADIDDTGVNCIINHPKILIDL